MPDSTDDLLRQLREKAFKEELDFQRKLHPEADKDMQERRARNRVFRHPRGGGGGIYDLSQQASGMRLPPKKKLSGGGIVSYFENGGQAKDVSLFDILRPEVLKEEERKRSIRRNEERIARDAAREYEVMKQGLDNTKADMLARAYAEAEDEYLVGMTPTNPNPFFEMAVSGGRHRGMFGSYPTRPVETIRTTGRDGKPVEINYAGYRHRGGKPFLANYVPNYRERGYDSRELGLRPTLEGANISSPIDYGDLHQQRLRPVFTDPYLATPEILAHEAAHIGEMEFIRENMDVFRPLMEERGSEAYDTAEFLVELFEPPEADEKFTDSSVTDAERIAAQAYFRTGELDTEVLGPALSALLVRLRGAVRK